MKKRNKKIYFCVMVIALIGILTLVIGSLYKQEGVKKELLEEVPSQEPSNKVEKPLAETILESMTLEEKVGQMFFVRHPDKEALAKISEYHLGGYLLFAKDFENKNKEEVITMVNSYQESSQYPLFIGVDEEGGIVNRVSKYQAFRDKPFSSPQALYRQGGLDLIKSDTIEKANLLKELGINVNFAPVSDVSVNSNDYMYSRSFGQNAEMTSNFVKTVTETMKEHKMASVLKHFPGYGNNKDTHTGIANDYRSYEEFVNSDFLPFQAGIESGADMVLVSHNIVHSMDSSYPASLSKKVHQILRDDLSFSGVIITDELSMKAVQSFAKESEVAVLAVQAGNDILCCTDFETQIPAVIEAVRNGQISEEQINESVQRILNLKVELGLI